MLSSFVSASQMRAAFSEAMSAMYRAEVPQYATLIEIVETVNAECVARGDSDPVCTDRARLTGNSTEQSAWAAPPNCAH